ncbi:MAG: (deoxy)nucleoside triphosphate pyrophosphohydrolase [Bacteroidales bacterium]|nr:(deoxy)nucleoside triphosphate pyrophosphohydrolase [Bacteroidales bacterium]
METNDKQIKYPASSIPVSCAVIFEGKRILACKRKKGTDRGEKWEFPGGKKEKNENDEECLQRELKEELNIEVQIIKKLKPIIHAYPDKTILLQGFVCVIAAGMTIELLNHEEIKWVEEKDIYSLDWSEADIQLIKQLFSIP